MEVAIVVEVRTNKLKLWGKQEQRNGNYGKGKDEEVEILVEVGTRKNGSKNENYVLVV